MSKFEEELIDLITRHQEAGVGLDTLISALELQKMSLEEQESGEGE